MQSRDDYCGKIVPSVKIAYRICRYPHIKPHPIGATRDLDARSDEKIETNLTMIYSVCVRIGAIPRFCVWNGNKTEQEKRRHWPLWIASNKSVDRNTRTAYITFSRSFPDSPSPYRIHVHTCILMRRHNTKFHRQSRRGCTLRSMSHDTRFCPIARRIARVSYSRPLLFSCHLLQSHKLRHVERQNSKSGALEFIWPRHIARITKKCTLTLLTWGSMKKTGKRIAW